MRTSPRCTFGVGHHSEELKVRLVADQQHFGILWGMCVNNVNPPLKIVKRTLIGDVVPKNESGSPAEMGDCHRAKAFLPRCVPDLEVDPFAFEIYTS